MVIKGSIREDLEALKNTISRTCAYNAIQCVAVSQLNGCGGTLAFFEFIKG